MKRYLGVLLLLPILSCLAGCSATPGSTPGISINVSGAFAVVETAGQPITLTAMVNNDPHKRGVKWTLSNANTDCSPGCGTLKPSASAPTMSAVYTPPSSAPANLTATITARSISDDHQIFAFNFQIVPPIVVSIGPKFANQTILGPIVQIKATVNNDLSGAGVTWTLTAGGADCSGPCGSITVDPAPSFNAYYEPPATVPPGAAAMPTITATSVSDPTKKDSFSFTIVAPVIAVTILNKFSTIGAGAAAITISAGVTNDFTYAGVTWMLTVGGAACSPTCGTLTASGAPGFSITYTPPSTLPADANDNPTITATSVTDPTKSDNFSFTIANVSSLFTGSYAFQVRGFDTIGQPMAMAGTVVSDGAGNITGGEFDYLAPNTAVNFAGMSGTYVVDNSFSNIPRVIINFTAGGQSATLKCALSADSKRGKIIEYDDSLRLNAGTIIQQDPASLTAANAAGSYAFGLDSDAGSFAGVSGRVVEAGQFTIGAGATTITGGAADAAQAGAPAVLIGTGATPATISPDVATAPDASGRGTLTITISGSSTQYAYYIVNSQQLNLIEIDGGGAFATLQSGTAQKQKALTASSVNATSVAGLTGAVASGGGPSTSAIVGVLTVTGGTTAGANYEYNQAGSVPANQSPTDNGGGGTILSFDPTTGRAVVVNGLIPDAAVYLYDVGMGYMIDVTQAASGANQGFSGPLIAQAQTSFAASDVTGNYIGLAGGSSSTAIPNIDWAANFAADGTYSALIDFTTPNLAIGLNGQAQNVYLAAGYYGLTYELKDTTLGRGVMTFPAGTFNDFNTPNDAYGSFYMIGPRQFVAIGQGPLGNGGDPSGVLFFDPQ